jgi:hypothetical protein
MHIKVKHFYNRPPGPYPAPYDKSLFADLTDFIKQVGNAYSQKVALKKKL